MVAVSSDVASDWIDYNAAAGQIVAAEHLSKYPCSWDYLPNWLREHVSSVVR